MADLKISQLEELESFLEGDYLPIVDTSNAGVPLTKKISTANLFAGIPLQDVLKYTLGPYGGSVAMKTCTGDVVLSDEDVAIQYLDPDGADRSVTFPAADDENHPFIVIHSGSSNLITCNDHLSTVLKAGDVVLFIPGSTQYYACIDRISNNSMWSAKGDLAVANGQFSAGVVSVGSDGEILVADSAQTNGVAWIRAEFGWDFVFGSGLTVVPTGIAGWIEVPYDCVITSVRLLADQSGSLVVDIWKNTYENYPPVDSDSITASTPPAISSAVKSEDTTLDGWTTSLAKGDVLMFNVDSASTIQQATLILAGYKTAVA